MTRPEDLPDEWDSVATALDEKDIACDVYDDYDDGMADGLARAARELREALRWIPVEKELPPAEVDVHFSRPRQVSWRGDVSRGYYDHLQRQWYTDLDDVDHWRELPEGPQ